MRRIPASSTAASRRSGRPAAAWRTAVALALSALAAAAPASAQETGDARAGAASAAGLVAEPSGLRLVAIGQPADLVVATLETLLGPPDHDTGWGPAVASPFGVCPGERVRGVRWGRLGVLLSDGRTSHGSAGYPHLFAYEASAFAADSGPAPRTARGIGLGSTVEELRGAYGDRVTLHEADGPFPARFEIAFGISGAITGSLSGTGPSGRVTFLTAGDPCGE